MYLDYPSDMQCIQKKTDKSNLKKNLKPKKYVELEEGFTKGEYELGGKVPPGCLIIDLDFKNPECEEKFELLCSDCGIDLKKYFSVSTPNGGFHIYFRLPEGVLGIPEHLPKYGNSIEFFSELSNRYVMLCGSRCENKNGELCTYKPVGERKTPFSVFIPDELLLLILPPKKRQKHTYKRPLLSDLGTIEGERALLKIIVEHSAELNIVDVGYSSWWKIGRLLKETFESDDKEGFNLYRQFSMTDDKVKFNLSDLKKKWEEPLKQDRDSRFTLRNLLDEFTSPGQLNSYIIDAIKNSLEDLVELEKIKQGASYYLSYLHKYYFDEFSHAVELKEGIEELKIKIKVEGKRITTKDIVNDIVVGGTWWRSIGYYISNNSDSYISLDRPEIELSEKAFNNLYSRLVPVGLEKNKNGTNKAVKASKFLHEYLQDITTISNKVFRPGAPFGFISNGDSQDKLFNTFNPEDLCANPENGGTLIASVIKKLDYLCNHLAGQEEDRFTGLKFGDFIKFFIAHIVQKPYNKINFAIVLKGPQGIGKTYITDLAKAIIGEKYSVEPTHQQLVGKNIQFNNFLDSKLLVTVQEFVASSAASYDTLKTLITDKYLHINAKNRDFRKAENYLNFIFTTNKDECIRYIEPTDRRMCVLNFTFSTKEDFERDIYRTFKCDLIDFFDELFNALTNYLPQLRYYFKHLEIPDNFLKAVKIGVEYTSAKASLTNNKNFAGVTIEEMKHLIKDSSVDPLVKDFINEDYLIYSNFSREVERCFAETFEISKFNSAKFSKIIKEELGYPYKETIRCRGAYYTLFIKGKFIVKKEREKMCEDVKEIIKNSLNSTRESSHKVNMESEILKRNVEEKDLQDFVSRDLLNSGAIDISKFF